MTYINNIQNISTNIQNKTTKHSDFYFKQKFKNII